MRRMPARVKETANSAALILRRRWWRDEEWLADMYYFIITPYMLSRELHWIASVILAMLSVDVYLRI